jgi:hypothetical protein
MFEDAIRNEFEEAVPEYPVVPVDDVGRRQHHPEGVLRRLWRRSDVFGLGPPRRSWVLSHGKWPIVLIIA